MTSHLQYDGRASDAMGDRSARVRPCVNVSALGWGMMIDGHLTCPGGVNKVLLI